MKNNHFFLSLIILVVSISSCLNSSPSSSDKDEWGTVEIVFTPVAGNKPLLIDSIFEGPEETRLSVKKLSFFLSDLAFSQSTGKETKVLSDNSSSSIQLVNLHKPNFDCGKGRNSSKFSVKVKAGEYSDIRFSIGVPRELNHSDPASALSPLNLGQAEEMYWEWNSGYIFFLTEGKIYGKENKLFHFAIGHDSRIMPLSFGNLFEVTPLIKVEKGKTTRIYFTLDYNQLFINGDKSFYSLISDDHRIVHGGHHADVLRNNLLRSIKFSSAEILD